MFQKPVKIESESGGGHDVFLVNTLYDTHPYDFSRLLRHTREADQICAQSE